MSKEVGKRKRGPPARPRGDPEPVIVIDPRARVIKYQSEQIVLRKYADLKKHSLLKFEVDSGEYEQLCKLVNSDLLTFKTINWDLLDSLGQRKRIEELLGSKFKAMLDLNEPQYHELTLEFLSTFQFKDGNFAQSNAVSFSLGRHLYNMTIAEFAVASGFYTDAEVSEPGFVTSLRGAFLTKYDMCIGPDELETFWNTISICSFSSANVASDIRDPVFRYIHRVLVHTLIGRGSGDNKVNWLDIFCLMAMVDKVPINYASLLAWSFHRTRRGGKKNRSRLDMGPYVTRIARYLGVFDRFRPDILTKGLGREFLEEKDLKNAGILKGTDPVMWEDVKTGPQIQAPARTAATRAGLPSHRQRPSHRSERPGGQLPVREPRPEDISMDSLWNRMESGFDQIRGYVTERRDELRQMIEANQRRQDEHMRHMMRAMSITLPASLRQPDDAGPSGSGAPGGSGYGHGGSFYRTGNPEIDNAEPYHIYEQESEEDEDEG